MLPLLLYLFFFFFNDTATTEIYTLSLHDALPISGLDLHDDQRHGGHSPSPLRHGGGGARRRGDRKSTRLNSSHLVISYAVFCLKKKKKKYQEQLTVCTWILTCMTSSERDVQI